MPRSNSVNVSNREKRIAVTKALKNTITNMETYDLILTAAAERMDEMGEDEAAAVIRSSVRLFENALPLVKHSHKLVSVMKKEKDGSEDYGIFSDGDAADHLGHGEDDEDLPRKRSARKGRPPGK
jgi:hypothetical protein